MWLPSVSPVPSCWLADHRPFQRAPDTLLVHSGAVGEGVAEYLSACTDGRRVSAHLAWHRGLQDIVQMLPLDLEGWHAGGSTILGERANGRSIGLELSGPWHQDPRRGVEREAFLGVVGVLLSVLGLSYWTTHAAIASSKRDPGPGFSGGWLEGSGLTWVGR